MTLQMMEMMKGVILQEEWYEMWNWIEWEFLLELEMDLRVVRILSMEMVTS